jgi:hypothetical protein
MNSTGRRNQEGSADTNQFGHQGSSSSFTYGSYQFVSKPNDYFGYLCYNLRGGASNPTHVFNHTVRLVKTSVSDSVGLVEIHMEDKVAMTIFLNGIADSFPYVKAVKTMFHDDDDDAMVFVKAKKDDVLVYYDKKTNVPWDSLPRSFEGRIALQVNGVKVEKKTGQASFMVKLTQVLLLDDGVSADNTTKEDKYLF